MTIEVQIKAPELSEAITRLALALEATAKIESGEIIIPAGTPVTVTDVKAEPEKPKRTRKATPKPAESAQENAVEPEVTQTEQVAAEPEPAAAEPQSAPEQAVPTIDQIAAAGAKLLDDEPAKMEGLLKLLGDFGVQAITQLKPEQLGDFAAALRQLGAEV